MGISRKPLSVMEKSKKITKLSPATSNHDQYLIASGLARGANMDVRDWRSQLFPGSRQRIVNKIMDTLQRHLHFSDEDGLIQLRRIAARFEEKIYVCARNQSDYLRKISLKILSMESRSQNPMPNSLLSNNAGSSNGLPRPA